RRRDGRGRDRDDAGPGGRSRPAPRGSSPRRRRPPQGLPRDRARHPRRRAADRPGRAEPGQAMTVELIQGLLLAFAIVVILMPPYIRLLRSTGFTKQIRIAGPQAPPINTC